jgi:hypothetical protein
MNRHDTVVPPSRLQVVLLQENFKVGSRILKFSSFHPLEVSDLQWYVADRPHLGKVWLRLHFTRTGKTGENGQSFAKDSQVLAGSDRRFSGLATGRLRVPRG